MTSINVKLVTKALNKFTRAKNYLLQLSPFLIYLLYERKRTANNVGILYDDKYLYVLNRYNLLECVLESNLIKFILSTICRMYHVWMY